MTARTNCCWSSLITCSLVGVSLLLGGCDPDSGLTGRERLMKMQNGFADMVAAAGGTAEIKLAAAPGMPQLQQEGWYIQLSGAQITDDIIEGIMAVTDKNMLLSLDLSKSTITDAQLGKLGSNGVLRSTVMMDLSETGITDAGIDTIAPVHALMALDLSGTSVSKEAVDRLKKRQTSSPDTPPPFRKGPKVKM